MSTDQHTPALSLAQRWQRQAYLSRVELWLDPMPRSRRKQILGELRANLEAAAHAEGMAAAIDDLGKPRALARQYLQAEPQGRPTWYHGVFAVSGALVLWLGMLTVYIVGSLNTLLAAGVTDPVDLTFLGTPLTAEAHDEAIGVTFTVFWPSLIGLLVIFLLFSRIWRLLRRRRARAADDGAARPA